MIRDVFDRINMSNSGRGVVVEKRGLKDKQIITYSKLALGRPHRFQPSFLLLKKNGERRVVRRCKDMWAAYNRLKLSPHILMHINMNACVCVRVCVYVCVCVYSFLSIQNMSTQVQHILSQTHTRTRVLEGGWTMSTLDY